MNFHDNREQTYYKSLFPIPLGITMKTHLNPIIQTLTIFLVLITIGVIIVWTGLEFKKRSEIKKSSKISQSLISVQDYVSPSPQQIKDSGITSISNDLSSESTDSYLCEYSDKDSTQSAVISNNMISVELREKTDLTRMIIKGDCAYVWKDTHKTGEKQCGVGEYVQFFPLLSQLSTSPESISQILSNSEGMIESTESALFFRVFSRCKKTTSQIKDSIFELPSTVTFSSP